MTTKRVLLPLDREPYFLNAFSNLTSFTPSFPEGVNSLVLCDGAALERVRHRLPLRLFRLFGNSLLSRLLLALAVLLVAPLSFFPLLLQQSVATRSCMRNMCSTCRVEMAVNKISKTRM